MNVLGRLLQGSAATALTVMWALGLWPQHIQWLPWDCCTCTACKDGSPLLMKAPLMGWLGLQSRGRHIVGNTTHTLPVAPRNPPRFSYSIFFSPDKGQTCMRTGKITSKSPTSTDRAESDLLRCSNHRQTTFGFEPQSTCCP